MRCVELSSREITHFSSQGFTHSRVARSETWQVSLVTLDGVIGASTRQHETAAHRPLRPRGVCGAGEHAELEAGEAVEWQDGEWHETRSLEPARLLIVEGHWE
jgi:hypothetical protein